jgi:phytoene dehydrogenase-like protein
VAFTNLGDLARFGWKAIQSARGLAKSHFRTERGAALFAGNAAHSIAPLTQPTSAAIGLLLAVAGHAVGWPIARGGAHRIATALASYLCSLGGEIQTGAPVGSLDELPKSRVVLLDLTARQVLRIAGDRLPPRFRRELERFHYGPGVFKIDWALSGPIPWTAAECGQAGTVHVGGTLDEIVAAEAAPWADKDPEKPFVLLAQPSLFDPLRFLYGRPAASTRHGPTVIWRMLARLA